MSFLRKIETKITHFAPPFSCASSTLLIIPISYLHQILDTVRGRLDRGKVGVTVLDPVSTEGMTLDKDLDALTNDVREKMLKVFQQDS